MSFSENKAREITTALHGQWFGSYGVARCPVHMDNKPSLSLSSGKNDQLLARCHAGCSFDDIIHKLRAMGLIGGNGNQRIQNLTLAKKIKPAHEKQKPRKSSGMKSSR